MRWIKCKIVRTSLFADHGRDIFLEAIIRGSWFINRPASETHLITVQHHVLLWCHSSLRNIEAHLHYVRVGWIWQVHRARTIVQSITHFVVAFERAILQQLRGRITSNPREVPRCQLVWEQCGVISTVHHVDDILFSVLIHNVLPSSFG